MKAIISILLFICNYAICASHVIADSEDKYSVFISEPTPTDKSLRNWHLIIYAFSNDSCGIEQQLAITDTDSCLDIKSVCFPLKWVTDDSYITVKTTTNSHFQTIKSFRILKDFPSCFETLFDEINLQIKWVEFCKTPLRSIRDIFHKTGSIKIPKDSHNLICQIIDDAYKIYRHD